MIRFITANITRTALAVVLLSVLPALGIIAASGMERYRSESQAIEERGQRFVRTIAARQSQVAEVMHILARFLVRLDAVQEEDMAGASEFFSSLVEKSAEYVNIFLLNNDGTVAASGLPMKEGTNFSRHSFFKRTLRRNAFSVGSVVRSASLQDPVLYFGIPVDREDGTAPGVLGISMRLGRYDEIFADLVLPDRAALYLLDGTGTLAAAFPRSDRHKVGDVMGGEVWRNVLKTKDDSGNVFVPDDSGGDTLHVVYRKLFLPGSDLPYFYVLYIRPESYTTAQARMFIQRDLTAFSLIGVVSVLLVLALCFWAVRRPWSSLLTAAKEVERGNLAARVPADSMGGEIGQLAKEFNSMAEMLESRDHELSAARNQAEQSRTAKSEFLANMSHEIRTSMNAILGMAYLVMKTELTAQQKGYVTKLLSAANSLLRVINDILDFSKMEAGKLTMETISFSLRRILTNLRGESVSKLTERQLTIDLNLDPQVPDHLLGDPLRLSQAMAILMDEAVARSERGRVEVGCSALEMNADTVVVAFTIRDAGIGLTPVQVSELREIFQRQEEDASSTLDKDKLRLAIANRLFRLMGGTITVESEFGSGSLFTATARFGFSTEELEHKSRTFHGRRALVVDPNPLSSQDLEEILVRFGLETARVLNLEDAATALRQAVDEGRPFGVLFLDWRPSAPDTPVQVSHWKAGCDVPAPPVILTTAAGRAELPVSLEELEIDGLLPKPVNESLVLDTLVTVLDMAESESLAEHEEDSDDQRFLKGVRILLVEDNVVNQQIATEILEEEGAVLTVAGDGGQAVETLSANPPGTFDLVLMDLQMPVMDGFTATRAIRKLPNRGPMGLPIIAMTAHSDAVEIEACHEAGMNDHAGKPIVVDDLFATLRRWLPVRRNMADPLGPALERFTALLETGAEPDDEAWNPVVASLETHLHKGRTGLLVDALRRGDHILLKRYLGALGAPDGGAGHEG